MRIFFILGMDADLVPQSADADADAKNVQIFEDADADIRPVNSLSSRGISSV